MNLTGKLQVKKNFNTKEILNSKNVFSNENVFSKSVLVFSNSKNVLLFKYSYYNALIN